MRKRSAIDWYFSTRDLLRVLRHKPTPNRGHHHLLLACAPKSGSTYLSTVISSLPCMERVRLIPLISRSEHELDRIELLKSNNKNYIAQHHVIYSRLTKELVNDFNIKPICLVRNIFDSVISFRDHHLREGTLHPIAYIPEAMIPLLKDKGDHEEFIIDIIVPWYFSFYVSWLDCKSSCLWLNYNDIVSDIDRTVKAVCDYSGIEADDALIADAVKAAGQNKVSNSRKNKVNTGRGNELSDRLKDKIWKMSRYYSDINFESLGLM